MSSKTAAELRAEVKALRAIHADHQPVSKMKKADLSGLLEKLKHNVETVPLMAQHQEKKVPKIPKDEVIKMPKQMVAEDKPKKAVKKAKKEDDKISVSSEEEKPKKAVKKSHVTKESHVTKKSHVKDDDEKKSKMKEKMAKIRAMKGKAKK